MGSLLAARVLRQDRHVFVAAAGQPDENPSAFVLLRPSLGACKGMRALERR
jgi:hypothetical protein